MGLNNEMKYTKYHNEMIMCTCAEINADKYLKYISEWVKQFEGIDADLYVINDGYVSNQQLEAYKLSNKIQFINLQPILGRKSLSVFPGFCRSFAKGLEISLQYEAFALVENDLKLLSLNKFKRYLKKQGVFTGYSNRYKMIESSLMIINNKDKRKELYEFYTNETSQNSEHWVEIHVETTLKLSKKNFVFIGERYEGDPKRLRFCKDYIAQYYDRYNDKSNIQLIISFYRLPFIFYPLWWLRKGKKMLKRSQNN
jgi:hypothetical protein